MNVKSLIKMGLSISLLLFSSWVIATEQEFVIAKDPNGAPDKLSVTAFYPIQQYNKNFNFDWNKVTDVGPDKQIVTKTEFLLSKIKDPSLLSEQDRQALGILLFKLGTYYTHVLRNPDLAIPKMVQAEPLLQKKEYRAWNYNHLAYAYELKYAASLKKENKQKSLNYSNKVISTLYPGSANKEVAFAYCIKGLIANDENNFKQAEVNFKNALSIYEKIPNGKDEQYIRTKSKLANIILEQNTRDLEAVAMLEQLKQFWLAKKNLDNNPYAARNFVILGYGYLKIGKAEAARDELNNGIAIYQNVYGKQSFLLAKPYHLLAAALAKLGDQELALQYEQKAQKLDPKIDKVSPDRLAKNLGLPA